MRHIFLETVAAEDAIEAIAEKTEGMDLAEIWKEYGYDIVIAVLILVVGWFAVKWICNLLQKTFVKRDVMGTSTKLLSTVIKFVLYFNVVLIAASVLDIPTTSVLALFSAFALSFSLALQDSLSLFASGVIIILSKPFTIGDFVEIPSEGISGFVSTVGLIHTRLVTGDNREVIIPNSLVTGNTLVNYSKMGLRRLDSTFSVSYNSDIALAKKTIMEVLEAEPTAEKEPKPTIMVTALSSSSVDIICKVYVKWDSYESLRGILNEKIKLAFDEKGIAFPYNQLDVHVK